MKRYGMILENGHVVDFGYCQKPKAIARMRRWKSSRLNAIKERSLVTPRLCLGLVCFKNEMRKDRNGQLLGKRGGIARANILSPERRKEIARKAANARWGVSA